MRLSPGPRFPLRRLILTLLLVGALVPAGPGMATVPPADPAPESPVEGVPQTVLPPYESPGEPVPRPPRSRQDRIVSAVAPLGMVAVLVAGLYVYWLIRKGL